MLQITAYGDAGLRVDFGNTISEEINEKIRSFCMYLEKEQIPGVIEWIPTYTAVSIVYDPYLILFDELKKRIKLMEDQLSNLDLPAAEVVHIPVLYGGEKGPDLLRVAQRNGLSEEEVISVHTGTDYLIYMMGFIPGFPYLGGMSKKIAAPRLSNPREAIPAGSVGIAGEQTGIYPLDSPGGWQIIGQTPVTIYDPNREQPILLRAGNYIRFVPITSEEFDRIEAEVKAGSYITHVEKYKK
ncbi:5-oxoprolinase subunit PxpB [Oceanobacillus damuensis]|uniref:5-oxoprolinase subunit PxpB n=1 Tax=Oceanobacillus damuensis TaxID=937928 RepID=UPI000832DC98|nr:5-oxoprolinase subunit PxpB [Oceanobacillus damuensis]